MKKIKVLVADDSAFMRRLLSDIVQAEPDLELLGTARDGYDALEKVGRLQPDVLTLDLEMPRLNGLMTLRRLMSSRPVPVVIVSSHSKEGSDAAMEALAAGAVEVVLKPRGRDADEINELKAMLPLKIRAAAGARVLYSRREPAVKPPSAGLVPGGHKEAGIIVAIGASTGGPRVLEEVMQGLPVDLPAAVLIVQHMPAGFTASFAQRLNQNTPLPVKEAATGNRLLEGKALLAPGDYHMKVDPAGRILLDRSPRVNHVRPAFDVTLFSLAGASWPVIVVVLTGMGKDGTDGTSALYGKNAALIIAQDPATAIVNGMPQAVIASGKVDMILPPWQIAQEIHRCCLKMAKA